MNMTKLQCIVFDLDGVLFDGREWHEEAFMKALNEIHPIREITSKFHSESLDGLSTRQKLTLLTNKFGLPSACAEPINRLKQKRTQELLLARLKPNLRLRHILQNLKEEQYRILCVSNSLYKTVISALSLLGILPYFDGIVSNEDAFEPKPSSEIYLRAFLRERVSPHQVLILEDSTHGRTAAYDSCAYVLPIVDSVDVTYSKINNAIESISRGLLPEQYAQPVNIVVPMAGLGSRFVKAGYTDPKPFINVLGKRMISWVIENMLPRKEVYGYERLPTLIKPTFHFIAQESHLDKFDMSTICDKLHIDYTITKVQKLTEGSACTLLLAAPYIDNDIPLVSVNSDQWLDWNPNEFYRALLNPEYDGCISVFSQTDESDLKWSYSAVDADTNLVTKVAEKEYISSWATTGVYGWRTGAMFVKYAKQMIEKNIRVNGEFYTCPAYNEAILDRAKIRNVQCKKLWGLGVPQDLEVFQTEFPKCHPSMI
jgi:beta-phosphoglucomutase-like phosphatase (HAD superfamily)/dTDP-glucose pyrophosphorylase